MRFSACRAFVWLAALTVIASSGGGYSAAAQAQADGRLLRPNAVIHSVANLDRSVGFYRDAVGLELDSTPSLPSGSGREIGLLTNAPDAEIRTATFRIPGTEVRLVLMQVSKSDGRNIMSRIQDPGVVKLVLRVRSMEAAFARVRGQITGVYTTGGAPVRPEGPNGVNQAVIMKDPDGCALEFVFQTNPPLPDNLPADSNIVGGWASFVVEDLAKSIEFYRDRLGFAIAGSGRPAAATLLALEGTPEATSTVSTGSRPPGAAYTWFMYDFRGIERKPLQARLQDPGTAAVSFWVDNLPGLLTRLRAAGTHIETAGGESLVVGGSRRAFIRDPSGILIELAEQPATAAATGACDRACLGQTLDRFLAALLKHDVAGAPLASTFRYTENAVQVRPGDGLWKSASTLGQVQRRYIDPVTGQAAYFGLIDDGSETGIATLRIKVEDGKVTEGELVIARKATGILDPQGLIAKPPPNQAVARGARTSRDDLVKAASSYFDGLQSHVGTGILAHPGCTRIENGVTMTGVRPGRGQGAAPVDLGDCANMALMGQIAAVVNRRFPVVDEEAGVVVGMGVFTRPPNARRADGTLWPRNLLTEIFAVEGGRIRGIWAAMHYLDEGVPAPGW